MANGSCRESGSFLCDSDSFREILCSLCEKSSQKVCSVKYCVDCDQYLCETCLEQHGNIGITRGHRVLDQGGSYQGHSMRQSQRCKKHGGKLIDVYCPTHDVVGCSTCIALEHSPCKNKQYIPDVGHGIKETQEYKNLEKDVKSVKFRFDTQKKQREAYLQHLEQNQCGILEKIHVIRYNINDLLDKMEKEILDEAEENFKQKKKATNTRIAELNISLRQLEQTMEHMKSDNQDSDIFVACKIGKREMEQEMYPEIGKQEKDVFPERQLELHIDEHVKQILEGKRMLAIIKEKYDIQGIEYNGDRMIDVPDEKRVCSVLSMCALPNGCLVMTDFNNQNLKKFDQVSNQFSTLIDLPDHPAGLCLVDNTHLAVSLIYQKQIQFVSLCDEITLDHSFPVRDQCRGLAHYDGLLYVCCGGSPIHHKGRGHVGVYNCQGQLLRCWFENIWCPEYISVVNDGFNTIVYISDFYKGMQMRGLEGDVKYQFPTNQVTYLPFCLIGTNQICVGEHSTANMYMYTRTDYDRQVPLEKILKRHVKGKPTCLYFDEISSRLIVAFQNCNIIGVFDLKM